MTDLERAHAFIQLHLGCQDAVCTFAANCDCAAEITALVAAERERCARIAEKYDVRESPSYLGNWYVGRGIAAAIRKGE